MIYSLDQVDRFACVITSDEDELEAWDMLLSDDGYFYRKQVMDVDDVYICTEDDECNEDMASELYQCFQNALSDNDSTFEYIADDMIPYCRKIK